MVFRIIWCSISSGSVFLGLNLGTVVKPMFPSDFYSCLTAKPEASQNWIIVFEHNASSLHVGFIHNILPQARQVKREKIKGMGDSVTFLFPLCTAFFSCSDSQMKRFELIYLCAVGHKIMQVLLYSLLNSLCFLQFKQMKTNQGAISSVSTQFYKISEFVFLLQKCIGYFSP